MSPLVISMRCRQLGVTLMELMIVAAVVAILAMMAYPGLSGYISKGYDSEAIEEISVLEVVLAQYFIDNSTYVSAVNTAAITSSYGWKPGTLKPVFDYAISANTGCPTGITLCYTITATGKASTATEHYPVEGRVVRKTSWGYLSTGDVQVK
ncbi:MAG: prepilin-type N-terminal cleavage/methylation domain-containing protein [Gammaproteobacteria bacterium]|nr:prepilin-type N-terminal cleavage/methylation domain-containing protein [Gammaproteobacteria bacterium]